MITKLVSVGLPDAAIAMTRDGDTGFGYALGDASHHAARREMPTMTTDECIASVWCPRCEAAPGQLCRDVGRGWIAVHPERVAIARAREGTTFSVRWESDRNNWVSVKRLSPLERPALSREFA
jgi:hypothetical protein